ncbi:MAG: transcriptional regulator, GntR family [Clostridia bacterium]|jgi:GntR family transcriptional regulator|nr:transcriptional regulator, GntR family [Clostridia bacterium]
MSKEVMHQQFYQELLTKIKSGEFKNGEKLPAERTLCDMYNISRTTVREALRNLEIEGYVVRKQGSGSFVQLKSLERKLEKLYTLRNMFQEQGIKHEVKLLSFEIIKGDKGIAEHLNLEEGEDVIYMVRLFYAADVPYTIEYTYLPLKLFPQLTVDMVHNNGLYNTLESMGQKPDSAVETIKAIQITRKEKELLNLGDDIVAIETKRMTYSVTDLIEYTKNIIRNDYFVYTVDLTK